MTSFAYDSPAEMCTKAFAQAPWSCNKLPGGAQKILRSLGVASNFTGVKHLGPSQIDGVACQGVSGLVTFTVGMGKPVTVSEHVMYWIATATKLPVEMITQAQIAQQTSTTTVTYADWNSPAVASHIPASVP